MLLRQMLDCEPLSIDSSIVRESLENYFLSVNDTVRHVRPISLVEPTSSLQFAETCISPGACRRLALPVSLGSPGLPHVPSPSASQWVVYDVNDVSAAHAAALDVVSRGVFSVADLQFLPNLSKHHPSPVSTKIDLHERVFI